MIPRTADPPTGRSLARLVRVSISRPWLTIALGLALAVAGGLYTARTLTFQTSSVQLLPPHHLYVQRFKDYLRDFGELNDIVVVIEAPSVPQAKAYADRLATEIRRLPGAGRVAYRVDPELFKGQALLYLSSAQLEELADKIRLHRTFVERYAARPSLAELFDAVAEEIARRLALGFVDLGLDVGPKEKLDAGFVDTLLGFVSDQLDAGRIDASPWGSMFTSAAEQERSGYFFSADDRLLFLLVEARREAANFTDNEHFVAGIRSAIAGLKPTFPDVAAGATGAPALSNDEMLTAFRDSKWSTLLAAVLTVGFLMVLMRRAVEPLVMLAVLLVSLAWSLGIIAATVGYLTVFSVMFISLLIGIGIDYGVYVFFRYEEELGGGRTPREALEVTARRSGPGILFGTLAAGGTFGALMLTEFRGIQEFGFIAGISIVMAFVSMLTVLPAVLVLMPHCRARVIAREEQDEVARLGRLQHHAGPIVVVAAALTVGALATLPGVRFDYNRLNLQARGTESVIWERKIMESRRSGFAALASANSPAELQAKRDAFAALPAVSEVTSVLRLIPPEQDAKIATVRRLAPLLAEVHVGPAPPADAAAVRRALGALRHRLQIAQTEAEGQTSTVALRSAHDRAAALLARLERADAGLVERLGRVEASLRDDFAAKLRTLQDNLAPRPVTLRDLPTDVTRKFVGASGRLLMFIYPGIDTWEQDGAREFVQQLRTVDPAVTGAPVISYEASRLVERAYRQGTLYAAVLAAVLAAIMLRRPLPTVLALVPLALGTIWTVGVMRVCGLSFNLANVWGLPLIIGACAEYGLMVVLRWRERVLAGRSPFPRSVVLAVTLNGLTNLSGFGSLMIARHQGIFGLGLLLTIGTIAALVSSLVLLPALMNVVDRGVTRKEP